MTGCGCHDPAVFGHLDCDQAAPFYRTLAGSRRRGEGSDRALDRRLRELRAPTELPEWNPAITTNHHYGEVLHLSPP